MLLSRLFMFEITPPPPDLSFLVVFLVVFGWGHKKYVGKLVAALWEKELTMGSVFTLLRDRPLAESPVVAMKALVTTMKV